MLLQLRRYFMEHAWLKEIYTELKKKNFVIKEECLGQDGSHTSQLSYVRIGHPKLNRIKIAGGNLELFMKFKLDDRARPIVCFSLDMKKYNCNIPFMLENFKTVTILNTEYRSKIKTLKKNKIDKTKTKRVKRLTDGDNFMENLAWLLDQLHYFVELMVSLSTRAITIKEKSNLLEDLVQSRFKDAILNTRNRFHYQDFNYDQFTRPLKKEELDMSTFLGYYITIYVNLFDEKDYIKGELPTIRKDGSSLSYHTITPITNYYKLYTRKTNSSDVFESFIKPKGVDSKDFFEL